MEEYKSKEFESKALDWDNKSESFNDYLIRKEFHNCSGSLPYSGYGEAVDYCFEDEDGYLEVGNGEYASRINYCPFCGYKAPTQLKIE